MKIVKIEIPFQCKMTRTQIILGWIYVALHIFALPRLLQLFAEFSPNPVNSAQCTLLWYCLGIVFILCVLLRWLRGNFDMLLDNLIVCIICMVIGVAVQYVMSIPTSVILIAVESNGVENPGNANMLLQAAGNYGIVKAVGIFIAPIVEEVLFRGVVFGSIRPRSRFWAYAVSVLLFSAYHVAGYAVGSGDLTQLIYILQYVPAAIVLAWVYEHSGCIWTSIFYHMGYNALSFAVMNLLDQL